MVTTFTMALMPITRAESLPGMAQLALSGGELPSSKVDRFMLDSGAGLRVSHASPMGAMDRRRLTSAHDRHPKAVHLHRSINHNAIARFWGSTSESVVLAVVPFFTSGMSCVAQCHLLGATLVINARWSRAGRAADLSHQSQLDNIPTMVITSGQSQLASFALSAQIHRRRGAAMPQRWLSAAGAVPLRFCKVWPDGRLRAMTSAPADHPAAMLGTLHEPMHAYSPDTLQECPRGARRDLGVTARKSSRLLQRPGRPSKSSWSGQQALFSVPRLGN